MLCCNYWFWIVVSSGHTSLHRMSLSITIAQLLQWYCHIFVHVLIWLWLLYLWFHSLTATTFQMKLWFSRRSVRLYFIDWHGVGSLSHVYRKLFRYSYRLYRGRQELLIFPSALCWPISSSCGNRLPDVIHSQIGTVATCTMYTSLHRPLSFSKLSKFKVFNVGIPLHMKTLVEQRVFMCSRIPSAFTESWTSRAPRLHLSLR